MENPWGTGSLQMRALGKGTCGAAVDPEACVGLWPEGVGAGSTAGAQDSPGPAGGRGDYVPCVYHSVPGHHGCACVQVRQCLPFGLGESPLPALLGASNPCLVPALIFCPLSGSTNCQPHRVSGEPCLHRHPLQGLRGPGPGPNKVG